ncbi:transglycosylase domain-containing protein [Pelagovum pacificum]|uniref:peptidoglycan glycosyltransferase n=1 Tax=Pelagovum pacificum TaxID=2588711 RepID=A0A5C5GHJ3_9RHOB|nr:transglycosylase domain-containing protein [Pelagovum pacificum]QQA42604.1 penicillin-binding protein [Pelagovum pacificum]TNY34245.1 penicillin-binding protein [Pelagovum pacificum]
MSGNGGKRGPLVADKRYGGGSGKGSSGRGSSGKRSSSTRKPKRTQSRRTKSRRPRGPLGWIAAIVSFVFGWFFRLIWRLTWRLGLAVCLLIALGVGYYASTLPQITELVDARTRGSVTMLDRDGETFAWRGDQFGGMIRAEDVSPHLHDAVVATEDRRFYRHIGVDPRGVASAIRINLSEGRGPLSGNGGSTITQQTAKLLCLGRPYDPDVWENETEYEADCRRTTLWRKVQEAVYAMAMEVRYSKEDILTIYLNRAYLGAGSRGFEAAAQRYFGRSAAQVTPAESAMLAGLLKAPSTYAPTSSLDRAQNRANIVIGLMEDQGYLTAAQASDARNNPARLSQAAEARAGGYFADWVMESGPEFYTRNTTEDVIIRTTFDPRLQRAAEEGLLHIFDTKVREGSVAEAAVVVMSADGAVRAMVGGRDVRASAAFNRATQALRQTGSSFKPFIYAAALDMDMSPLDLVEDAPFCMNVPGSGEWCPSNYTNSFRGPVTLTEALTHSLNIPAVKVSEAVGRDNVRTVAEGFGIESDIADGPAMALGASESTLIEMTGAYAGILNGGSAVLPYGLTDLRVQGENTSIMETTGGIRERVIRRESAQQLVWMMSKVVEDGTGARAQIPGWQIAGKTGTTQANRDAWFIGFTADYVVGVWMGNDDNSPLNNVSGGGLPTDIWHEVMVRITEGMTPNALPMTPPTQPGNSGLFQADSRNATVGQDEAEQVLQDVLTDILNNRSN